MIQKCDHRLLCLEVRFGHQKDGASSESRRGAAVSRPWGASLSLAASQRCTCYQHSISSAVDFVRNGGLFAREAEGEESRSDSCPPGTTPVKGRQEAECDERGRGDRATGEVGGRMRDGISSSARASGAGNLRSPRCMTGHRASSRSLRQTTRDSVLHCLAHT